MKKLFVLSVAILAIILSGCSDASKAKSMAKKYLAENSNDGKIEIVKAGALEDYTYEFDARYLVEGELELAEMSWKDNLDLMRDWEVMDMSDEYVKENYDKCKAEADKYKAQYDSLKVVLDNTTNSTYQIKKMDMKIRGNNALGNKVVQDVTMYFDKDLKKVGAKPCEVIK